MNKLWYICNTGNFYIMQWNQLLKDTKTWMNLKGIMLSKRNLDWYHLYNIVDSNIHLYESYLNDTVQNVKSFMIHKTSSSAPNFCNSSNQIICWCKRCNEERSYGETVSTLLAEMQHDTIPTERNLAMSNNYNVFILWCSNRSSGNLL